MFFMTCFQHIHVLYLQVVFHQRFKNGFTDGWNRSCRKKVCVTVFPSHVETRGYSPPTHAPLSIIELSPWFYASFLLSLQPSIFLYISLSLAANTHILYKAAVSLCLSVFLSVCLSVCLYPPFRHDRRTATKFGTHIRVDMGLIFS